MTLTQQTTPGMKGIKMPLSEGDFFELLESMPEGKILFIFCGPDDIRGKAEDVSKLQELANDPELFHVIIQSSRPGAGYFENVLEHEHFPPESDLNDEMQYRIVKWKGLHWTVISIPRHKRHLCYEAAKKTKMRFEPEGHVPVLLGEGEIQTFPMVTDSVAVLISGDGSQIYEGPGGVQDEKISERFRVQKYLKEKGLDTDDPWK